MSDVLLGEKYTAVPRAVKMEQARREVLQAVLTVFAEHGYGGVTIDQVAMRAGVSPRTVHRYFRTKGELFADAIELPSSNFFGIVDRELGASTVGEAFWRALMGSTPEPGAALSDLVRVLTSEPDVRDRWLGRMPAHQVALAAVLRRHEHPLFADQNELFWSVRAAAVLAAFTTALGVWAEDPKKYELRALVVQSISHITNPVSS